MPSATEEWDPNRTLSTPNPESKQVVQRNQHACINCGGYEDALPLPPTLIDNEEESDDLSGPLGLPGLGF